MSFRESIRVRVVHSDALATAGLMGSLGPCSDFLVAEGEHGSGTVDEHEVVIADLGCAMKLARRASESNRRPPKAPAVVVVSGPDRERDLKQALACGVQGYLVDGFTIDELADSVRAVHRGARYLCPRAASRLAESTCFSPLTEREEAVLELVAKGLCNKSVARDLGIALGTVKSHLKSAYAKLFVDSRTQAVIVSERRGLLARRRDSDAPAGYSGTRHAAQGMRP